MKPAKKRNQKKLFKKIINEIVDIEFNHFLYEASGLSSSPMYQIFVQPFVNAGNVVKAETQKTGARIKGMIEQGIIGAAATLLPLLQNVPFSGGKTWQQAIDESKTQVKDSIGKINTKYAASYEAVRAGFASPDAAFILFSFNPGLYLGTALATGAIGSSLSAIGGMLGRDLSGGYNTWIRQNLGILKPTGTATYQGGISGGPGGYDGGVDGGGYYQELEEIANLFEVRTLQQVYDELYTKTYDSIKKSKKIPDDFKLMFNTLLSEIVGNKNNNINDKLVILRNFKTKIDNFNPKEILIANGIPVEKDKLSAMINASPQTSKIIATSMEQYKKNPIQMQPNYPESFNDWKNENPQLANEFWSRLQKNNKNLKDKKLESLSKDEEKILNDEYQKLISSISAPDIILKQKTEFENYLKGIGISPEIIAQIISVSFPDSNKPTK